MSAAERTVIGELRGAARQVLATAIGIGQSRLELVTVELEEERLCLARLWIACTITLFFGFLGAVLLAAWFVMWCEPENRLLALAALAGGAAAAAGLAAWRWHVLAAGKPALLHATLEALRQDRAACAGLVKP